MSLFGCDHAPLIAQLRADLAIAEGAAEDWKEVARNADSRADEWQRLHEQERKRYDELLQTVLAMKSKGAEVVPTLNGVITPELAQIPQAPPEADALKALIHERCGGNVRLRSMMLAQLGRDRKAGKSDEAIEQSIMAGVSSDGVPV